MTWLDVTTVALLVVVGVVEAKRGATPAAIDLTVVLLGVGLAKTLTGTLGAIVGSETTTFLALSIVSVVVAAVLSVVVDAFTKWDIGPFDAAAAGVLGAVTGLALAHVAFHAATLHGGAVAGVAGSSLLVSEVYDLRTIHALGDMMRNLGSGRRIVDDVKEQQQ